MRRVSWSAVLFVPGLLALGLAWIHAPAVLDGFATALGDQGDGRIMLFLIESTWRAVRSGTSPLSPPMFAPTPGALGFTDAHILWVPLYGALRGLGLDMVRAFSAMFVALLVFGYATSWLLFWRVLGIGAAAAAVGAFLFVFSNALTIKLMHGQMIGVVMLPTILLLLHAGWRAGRIWPATVAGLLTGLLAATSYVTAWFFVFFLGLAALLAVVAWAALRQPPGRIVALRLAGGYAGGLVLGLVPFLAIYGQQALAGRRRTLAEIAHFRPLFSDLLNLGANHPVWGPTLGWFGLPRQHDDTFIERFMGASPPVWLLAVAGAWLLWRHRAALGMAQRALLAAAAAIAIGTLLQFQYGGRIWPWAWVASLVPGAGAIRTTFRSELVAMLPLAALVAVALDRVRRWPLGWLAFALLTVAVVSDSAWTRAPYRLSAQEEARLAAAGPPPPPDCRVFALAPQPGVERLWYVMQSDAIMLALHWRLPTMNGNSSVVPPGWDLQWPEHAVYPGVLASWVARSGLRPHVCLYDLSATRWLDADETARLLDAPR